MHIPPARRGDTGQAYSGADRKGQGRHPQVPVSMPTALTGNPATVSVPFAARLRGTVTAVANATASSIDVSPLRHDHPGRSSEEVIGRMRHPLTGLLAACCLFLLAAPAAIAQSCPPSVPVQGAPVLAFPVFPSDNWWNTDIRDAPVDPASANFIAFIGATRKLHPDFGGEESPGERRDLWFPLRGGGCDAGQEDRGLRLRR